MADNETSMLDSKVNTVENSPLLVKPFPNLMENKATVQDASGEKEL